MQLGKLLCGVLIASFPAGRVFAETFDVVVYGGTSAAVTAAVQAKKVGKNG